VWKSRAVPAILGAFVLTALADRGVVDRLPFRNKETMILQGLGGHSMRILIAAVVVLATTASTGGASQAAAASGPSSRSIWDGVYTEEQARRGKEIYLTHCLSCHGEALEGGGQVHALVGPEFAANWNGLSLGDMLERMRISMPMDKPGTLSRQQLADVLSFVLSANKAPAGSVELPRQTELLNPIKFLATKPSGQSPAAQRRP